ncbi:hypothetical protein GS18_0208595 [Metabacillus indicus]|uniref:Uncharacterized protein n=1 Tax=Metabacillus indicus TaxID=246786 RepID=A0A084GZX0_METID|nr:hypothetical protein GS18_0208595 [Metabacillus indicus]
MFISHSPSTFIKELFSFIIAFISTLFSENFHMEKTSGMSLTGFLEKCKQVKIDSKRAVYHIEIDSAFFIVISIVK